VLLVIGTREVRRVHGRQRRRSENSCEIGLRKCCARMRTRFLWRRVRPSGFHASGGGGGVLDYQERLCCLELACQPPVCGVLEFFVALTLHFITNLLFELHGKEEF
jgi:hypothetical protein